MAFATITINAEVMIEASTKPEYSLAIKLLELPIVGTSTIFNIEEESTRLFWSLSNYANVMMWKGM